MNGNLRIGVVGLVLLLLSVSNLRAEGESRVFEPDSTLARSLLDAYSNHPEMAAARKGTEAAGLMERQAGGWQDPKFQVSLANAPINSFALDQEPMTGIWLMLSQSIPLTGKFGTQREIARFDMQTARASQRLRMQMVGEQSARAWYDWAWYRLSVATVDSTVSLLEDLLEVSRSRYETGAGMQQDLLRLQTEIIKLQEKRFDLDQKALKAGRRFAVSLGEDPAELTNPPTGISLTFSNLDRDVLRSELDTSSPALAILSANLQRAEAEAKLQRQKVMPDLNLSAGYGMRQNAPNGTDRPDFLTLSAGISLPLLDGRKQGLRAEAASIRADRTQSTLQGEKLKLLETLESLIDEDARHAGQRTLYTDGIIPLAEATLQSSMGAYAAGKIDVESVLKAQTTLLDARLMAHKHLAERAAVRVSLAALLGEFGPQDEPHTMMTAAGVER